MPSISGSCTVSKTVSSGDTLTRIFNGEGCNRSEMGVDPYTLAIAYAVLINGVAEEEHGPNFLNPNQIDPNDFVAAEVTSEEGAYTFRQVTYRTASGIEISYNDEITIEPITLNVEGPLNKEDSQAEIAKLIKDNYKIADDANISFEQRSAIQLAVSSQADRLAEEIAEDQGWLDAGKNIHLPVSGTITFQLVTFEIDGQWHVVLPGKEATAAKAVGEADLSGGKTVSDVILHGKNNLIIDWVPAFGESGEGEAEGEELGGQSADVLGNMALPPEILARFDSRVRMVIQQAQPLGLVPPPSREGPAWSETHIPLSHDLVAPEVFIPIRNEAYPEEVHAITDARLALREFFDDALEFDNNREAVETDMLRLYDYGGLSIANAYWDEFRRVQYSPLPDLPAWDDIKWEDYRDPDHHPDDPERMATSSSARWALYPTILTDTLEVYLNEGDISEDEYTDLVLLMAQGDYDELNRRWKKIQLAISGLEPLPFEAEPYYHVIHNQLKEHPNYADLQRQGDVDRLLDAYVQGGYGGLEMARRRFNRTVDALSALREFPLPAGNAVVFSYDPVGARRNHPVLSHKRTHPEAVAGVYADLRLRDAIPLDPFVVDDYDYYKKDEQGNFIFEYDQEGLAYLDVALTRYLELGFRSATERFFLPVGPLRYTPEEAMQELAHYWEWSSPLPASIHERNVQLTMAITPADMAHEQKPSNRSDKFPVCTDLNAKNFHCYTLAEIEQLDALYEGLKNFRQTWQEIDAEVYRSNGPINHGIAAISATAVVTSSVVTARRQAARQQARYELIARLGIDSTDKELIRSAERVHAQASRWGLVLDSGPAGAGREETVFIREGGAEGKPVETIGREPVTVAGMGSLYRSATEFFGRSEEGAGGSLGNQARVLGLEFKVEKGDDGFIYRLRTSGDFGHRPWFESTSLNAVARAVAVLQGISGNNQFVRAYHELNGVAQVYRTTSQGETAPVEVAHVGATQSESMPRIVITQEGREVASFDDAAAINRYIEGYAYPLRQRAERLGLKIVPEEFGADEIVWRLSLKNGDHIIGRGNQEKISRVIESIERDILPLRQILRAWGEERDWSFSRAQELAKRMGITLEYLRDVDGVWTNGSSAKWDYRTESRGADARFSDLLELARFLGENRPALDWAQANNLAMEYRPWSEGGPRFYTQGVLNTSAASGQPGQRLWANPRTPRELEALIQNPIRATPPSVMRETLASFPRKPMELTLSHDGNFEVRLVDFTLRRIQQERAAGRTVSYQSFENFLIVRTRYLAEVAEAIEFFGDNPTFLSNPELFATQQLHHIGFKGVNDPALITVQRSGDVIVENLLGGNIRFRSIYEIVQFTTRYQALATRAQTLGWELEFDFSQYRDGVVNYDPTQLDALEAEIEAEEQRRSRRGPDDRGDPPSPPAVRATVRVTPNPLRVRINKPVVASIGPSRVGELVFNPSVLAGSGSILGQIPYPQLDFSLPRMSLPVNAGEGMGFPVLLRESDVGQVRPVRPVGRVRPVGPVGPTTEFIGSAKGLAYFIPALVALKGAMVAADVSETSQTLVEGALGIGFLALIAKTHPSHLLALPMAKVGGDAGGRLTEKLTQNMDPKSKWKTMIDYTGHAVGGGVGFLAGLAPVIAGRRIVGSAAGKAALKIGGRLAASAALPVVVGLAIGTTAIAAGFAIYKNQTNTDQMLGWEREQDDAWGRFLNGDGFFDGIGDALFGAD